MERRGFVASLAAIVAAFLGFGSKVAHALPLTSGRIAKGPLHGEGPTLETPLDVMWSQGVEDDMIEADLLHRRELAGFDRALGVCEDCHERMGRVVVPVEEAPRGGVAFCAQDGGYEAVSASPIIRELRLCDECAEIRRRGASRYVDIDTLCLDGWHTPSRLGRIVNLTES